jgi:hypothetical protein
LEKKTITGIMLTLLIISMLTLAFKIESASTADYPSVYLDPSSIIDPGLIPGSTYTVSIMTDYIGSDIIAYQFTLSYDPSILNGVSVTNGDVVAGPVFMFIPGTFDNTAGKLSLTGAFPIFQMPPPVASGPGTLANVTFTVVGPGKFGITLGNETQLIGLNSTTFEEYLIVDAYTMPFHIGHSYFCNISTTFEEYLIVDAYTMPFHIGHSYFCNMPLPAIPATIDVSPDTLNLRSKGEWITCYIELPESYNAENSKVCRNRLKVRFDRLSVTALLPQMGEVELTVTGAFFDGTPFEGSDTIRVK